jgi:hypothetical protein
MYHAKETDLDVIMNIFKKNREWFPHVRSFHIKTDNINLTRHEKLPEKIVKLCSKIKESF